MTFDTHEQANNQEIKMDFLISERRTVVLVVPNLVFLDRNWALPVLVPGVYILYFFLFIYFFFFFFIFFFYFFFFFFFFFFYFSTMHGQHVPDPIMKTCPYNKQRISKQ